MFPLTLITTNNTDVYCFSPRRDLRGGDAGLHRPTSEAGADLPRLRARPARHRADASTAAQPVRMPDPDNPGGDSTRHHLSARAILRVPAPRRDAEGTATRCRPVLHRDAEGGLPLSHNRGPGPGHRQRGDTDAASRPNTMPTDLLVEKKTSQDEGQPILSVSAC